MLFINICAVLYLFPHHYIFIDFNKQKNKILYTTLHIVYSDFLCSHPVRWWLYLTALSLSSEQGWDMGLSVDSVFAWWVLFRVRD